MVEAYRNGENAINLKVLRSKTNDALKVNETVQNYLIEQKNNFPNYRLKTKIAINYFSK